MAFGAVVLDETRINDLRNTEKLLAIQDLVSRNQANATSDLKKKTGCKLKR